VKLVETFTNCMLQINGDGSMEEVYSLFQKAEEECIQHAEAEKCAVGLDY
jgi:hypothetical protein